MLMEAQVCVAEGVDPVARKGLADWVRLHTYRLPRAKIQDPELLQRADALFGEAAKNHGVFIEITAPDNVNWAKGPQNQAGQGSISLFGAAITLCTTGTSRGHFDETEGAIRDFYAWTPDAPVLPFLPTAVVAVDDHAWRRPRAHAQTDVISSAPWQSELVAIAVDHFQQWIQQHEQGRRGFCAAHSYDKAAFELAVILHAVQDLSSHAGVTNPEHAALMLSGKNPDGVVARLDRGQRWSTEVFRLVSAQDSGCLRQVMALKEIAPLDADAGEILGGVDALKGDYVKYIESGRSFPKGRPEAHVDWFPPDDDAAALKFFDSHVKPFLVAP